MKCIVCGDEFEPRRKWAGETSPVCGKRNCYYIYAQMRGAMRRERKNAEARQIARELRGLSKRSRMRLLEAVATGLITPLRCEMELKKRDKKNEI